MQHSLISVIPSCYQNICTFLAELIFFVENIHESVSFRSHLQPCDPFFLNENLMKMYSPPGHPRDELVSSSDLEKFSIISTCSSMDALQ